MVNVTIRHIRTRNIFFVIITGRCLMIINIFARKVPQVKEQDFTANK